MPNVEEHCKSTLKRYGVEGRDIHQWLDEPSKKCTSDHRQFRHDTETIKLVGEIFGKKYGKSLAENIALDHIMLDHKEEIERRKEERERQIHRGLTEEELRDFHSQPPMSLAWRLWIELHHKRKRKRTLGITWFPLNENSSFWDCELCGKRSMFRLKKVILVPSPKFPFDRIRVCSKCKEELMNKDEQIKLLNK